MQRNLVLERVYPYSPDHLWAALTDPAALSEWLMETDFQPFEGHRFQFRTKPAPGFDGVIQCEVIEVSQPYRLVYTWQGGPLKKPTVVTWTLDAVGGGTRLRLEHTGFEGAAGILISFVLGSGWHRILNQNLPALLSQLPVKQRRVQDD